MNVLPPRVYGTDSGRRKQYLPAGMAHPAKLVVGLQLDLIRRYTQAGQWIVDPFGGIGSALLAAALPLLDPWEAPRHVLVHELEANFVSDARENWAHLHRLAGQQAGRTYVDPLSGETRVGVPLGEVRILQGDSRHLPLPTAAAADGTPAPFAPLVALRLMGASAEELRRSEAEPAILLHHLRALAAQGHRAAVAWVAREKRRARTGHHPSGTPQAVIGSPPYVDARQSWPTPEGAENVRYGDTPGQIGGLAHGDVAAAIGSPPFGEANAAHAGGNVTQRPNKDGVGFEGGREAFVYSEDTPGQVGNMPYGDVAAVVSSPPYADAVNQHPSADNLERRLERMAAAGVDVTKRVNVGGPNGQHRLRQSYGADAVLSSPPYGDVASRDRTDEPYCQAQDPLLRAKYGTGDVNRHIDGYGEHTPGQIGDLPHVAAAMGSPPYANSLNSDEDHARRIARTGGFDQGMDTCKYGDNPHTFLSRDPSGLSNAQRHAVAATNPQIGAVGPETYASACLAVYRECYRVVRPGGILVLVTGNYVRNGAVIDLAADTIKLAAAAGWTPVERWVHQKASISFWRRLHHQQAVQQGRAPAVVTTEDVLVFCKGDQPGWAFAPLPPTTRAPVALSDRPAAPRATQGRLLNVLLDVQALADQEEQEANGDGDDSG